MWLDEDGTIFVLEGADILIGCPANAEVPLEVRATTGEEGDRPPIVVPPTVLVQRPPEAWGEGR